VIVFCILHVEALPDLAGKLYSYIILHYIAVLFTVELLYMAPDYTLIEFVQEPGYLRLTKQSRKKLNITTRMIHIGQ